MTKIGSATVRVDGALMLGINLFVNKVMLGWERSNCFHAF